jgi:hypothetical protein
MGFEVHDIFSLVDGPALHQASSDLKEYLPHEVEAILVNPKVAVFLDSAARACCDEERFKLVSH